MAPADRKRIVARYVGGESITSLARAFGWTRPAIRALLKREGVYETRPTMATSPEAITLIEAMAREGHRDAAIRQALTQGGHKTVNGGHWALSTIGRISNRVRSRTSRLGDVERFAGNVQADEGCEVWTGRLHADGYGLFEVDGRNVLAHRWAWVQKHGPIPLEVQLHHRCRRPACVKTAHLLPVSRAEHTAVERAEDAVIDAARSFTSADLATFPRVTDAEARLSRVGTLRPAEVIA